MAPPAPKSTPAVPEAAFVAQSKAQASVILISVDTLRADRLGCYGSRRVSTPNIDALAKGGTLFSQAGAQVPLTLPSHVVLLTSTYPFTSGVQDNGQQLAAGATTMAAVLKSRGYRTAAFVGGFVLDRRFGLDQGFEVYSSPFDLHRAGGTDPGDIKRIGEEVTQDAEGWLKQSAAGPFFLFLHLYDLHTPYELPQRLRLRRARPSYDTEVEYVDEVLGELIAFLQRNQLLRNSLVVFTSDHGESLGDHGESTHGYFIYQSTLRVPLIFHWPEGAAAAQARIDEPVGLIDVAPTVLQFLDITRPLQFQGRGLLGLARHGTPPAPQETYSESLYAHYHFGAAALRSLRVGPYKYIQAPRPEFYDLTRDPDESQNLYQSRKAVAAGFHERLLAILSRYGHNSGGAPPRPALSPETVERLNSLGYAAASTSHPVPLDSGPDPKDRLAAYESYGRALSMAGAGRLEEANSLLNQLLVQAPDVLDVRLSLGINQQRQGRHEEAAKTFREILKLDPANAVAHFDLGVSLLELRRLEEASREFQVALTVEPFYTRAEELLGTALVQQRRYDEARLHFDHVLTIDPNSYLAHYNLGVLATLRQQWRDAESHLQAAVRTDPRSPEAYNTLGSLFLQRGDLNKARGALSKAIELQPKFAWAHYNLGLVLRTQGDAAGAASEFRQALADDPQFRPAREALSSVAK